MQDYDTTSGSDQPDVAEPTTIEQVLTEVAQELPPVTLAGCLTVVAEVMPYALGHLHPVCTRVNPTGEHRIPTPFVWKDLETNEVYCHMLCAARDAIDKAARIAKDEEIYPLEATRG